MNKIVEYLFEGFLIMVFCTAVKNWFVGNANINNLIDLTKKTVEADTEIINTSHIITDEKYQKSLATIPYDEEYDLQSMSEFANSSNSVLGSFDGKNFYQIYGKVNPSSYIYLKVNGRCYKKVNDKFVKV